jgi:adenylate kinase
VFVFLLGPAGCGKGTQASLLFKKFGIKSFSIGQILLRDSKNDELSRESLNQGKLAPHEKVNTLVRGLMEQNKDEEYCVIDGYPRSISQASFITSIKHLNAKIIFFSINYEILLRRVASRLLCEGCGAIYNSYTVPTRVEGVCDDCGSMQIISRSDDNIQVFYNRIVEYEAKTLPVLEHCGNMVYNVSAEGTLNDVHNRVKKILNIK